MPDYNWCRRRVEWIADLDNAFVNVHLRIAQAGRKTRARFPIDKCDLKLRSAYPDDRIWRVHFQIFLRVRNRVVYHCAEMPEEQADRGPATRMTISVVNQHGARF